jgi:alpha-L-rhamnosidase
MSPAEQKPMPGPLSTTHGSAGWADVIVSAPLDLYDAYGSTTALEECWDAAERWMAYAEGSAASGRHASRTGNEQPHERYLWDTRFHFGEWLEPEGDMHDFGAFMRADKSEVASAYLHRSAVQMARIAEVLGKGDVVIARYQELAAGTRDAWQREFIDDDGHLRVQTQASHVRALHFGLAPEHHRATIAHDLVDLIRAAGTHLGTGFLSTPYLLPALADNGFVDVAFELLMQDTAPSWMYMRAKGATTIWEDWNGIDAGGEAHASLNHYSKGAVVSFLHQYVAGLRATEPGYRAFVVQPVVGGCIRDAATWLESPQGRIEASWHCCPTAANTRSLRERAPCSNA